jgi:hypothetical protein
MGCFPGAEFRLPAKGLLMPERLGLRLLACRLSRRHHLALGQPGLQLEWHLLLVLRPA